MSLRTKFGVLLWLMGLSVCLALGAAWWSLRIVSSEVREPFRSMSDVLNDLAQAHDGAADALAAIDPSRPIDRPALQAAIRQSTEAVESLQGNEWVSTRAGAGAFRNVRTRLADAARLASSDDDPGHAGARTALTQTRELIDRIQTRVVTDTRAALQFGDDLEGRLAIVLGSCLVIAGLTIALGTSLVRRWVLRPVANLRAAAERIGAGDFAHRVQHPGPHGAKDELAQLGHEVNAMASTIKTMQDQRVEQERLAAIGEMVRRLSHNLRNPLGGIRTLAELTRSDLKILGPAGIEMTESQTRIINAVDRFEHWLNDLLSVTRPMQVTPITTTIPRFVKDVAVAHEPQAVSQGVHLYIDVDNAPPTAAIDPRHLEHAVSAILSNAIEAAAGPSSTTKAVRVRAVDSGPDWVLSIEDSGPGISPEAREQIFRPYFTTKPNGNGIGLAIAHQVVKAHAGRIDVDTPAESASTAQESTLREFPGARFRIVLPKARPGMADGLGGRMANLGQEGADCGQDSGDRR